MSQGHFEFGAEIHHPQLEVGDDGRLHTEADQPIRCAPYFQWVDQPAERLAHFLTTPFPGHEWNHFALYAIQRSPVEIVRALAYAALAGDAPPPEPQWARAQRQAIADSIAHFDQMLPLYEQLFGRAHARQVADASRSMLSSASFVAEQSTTTPQAPPPDSPHPPRPDLDATYLHAAFTAETFHAYLDIRMIEAQGRDPAAYLHDRAGADPLLKRLLGMRADAAARFLVLWHRQSYRFPRFTKRFFRSVARLPQSHVKFPIDGAES